MFGFMQRALFREHQFTCDRDFVVIDSYVHTVWATNGNRYSVQYNGHLLLVFLSAVILFCLLYFIFLYAHGMRS
jgi:hypothetical protein